MTMPYGGGGGYSYTPEGLNSIVGQLRHGAKALDGVAARAVQGVDAGTSSDVVGTVLADLIKMATASAGALSGSAEKVHAANGAYDDIENSQTGQIKRAGQSEDPDTRREMHVHG
ncbi:hypothetical protein ATK36_4607 [Amycolatopsis sulphurea]|uniref:Uncharacterized protein n=1 Tax=Amycolatopsis sulphurea TaxID=76022 RepID=A0A2A9FG26_9PSEU|nr:hypothetical protein [Amycolatopsis sulphurea]PFG49450.1 hypothetical protein ATK36_4607 [Amycolatopsis sulphurea]